MRAQRLTAASLASAGLSVIERKSGSEIRRMTKEQVREYQRQRGIGSRLGAYTQVKDDDDLAEQHAIWQVLNDEQ